MEDSGYLRFPHLRGDLLCFVADNDVWLADLSSADPGTGGGTGGPARAWRLTADRAPVAHPRLDPTGTRVAWVSTRDGAGGPYVLGPRDVYTAAVDGGPVRRLTHWGQAATAVRGWLSPDEVLVGAWAEEQPTRHTWMYAVPMEGPPRRLPYGPANDLSVRADGAVLLGSPMQREPAYWKRYLGGRGCQIWYSPDGEGYERILAGVGNHLANPMWIGERVVFLSDHEGAGALYSCLPDGSQLRRHTDHGAYYARNATTDGSRVVYECFGELWLLDSLDAQPRRLDIRLSGARTGRDAYPISASSNLGEYTLNRDGRVLAVEVRGTVHWLPVEQEPARVLLDKPGVRARLPRVVPGSSAVLCVSDEGGEDGLDLIPADGGAARRIGHGELGRVLHLAVSPDGKTAAVSTDDGRLVAVTLESGALAELARADHREPYDLAFSPDSGYVAWAQSWMPGEWRGQIKLARLADGAVFELTGRRHDDHSPVFTGDGKYLAFLSNRAFDPVYDAHVFDLGFLPGVRPYLVTLDAQTPSPFAPELNGRPVDSADKREAEDGDSTADDGDKRAADSAAAETPPTVKIDFADLSSRVVPFPVPAGAYSKLRAVKDGVLWLSSPRSGELHEARIGGPNDAEADELQRYDLVKRKLSTVLRDLDAFAVSGDGARLAHSSDGTLKVGSAEADGEKAVEVDLERVRVRVDPVARWAQMYDETWRLMRDNYWHADMRGIDWSAARERYRPALDRISTDDDLYDLLWELQGETGTSHAYVMPHGSSTPAAAAPGLLGADLERDEDGQWRIVRILPGESAIAAARPPLAAPGVAAAPGDVIVAVDGRPVDPDHGPAKQLLGKAEKPVELTLRRAGAEDRRVVVVPLGSEQVLRYRAMVTARRAAVHEASGGRLGYVHVPDMQARGWTEFNRDFTVERAREGLVVDVRDNRGGHVSQLVVEKLGRRIIGWSLSRRRQPRGYPYQSPRGPIVAVADEWAGSDGDIVAHVLKTYGIATVVGTRTWGGTVGIDARYELVDDTLVTQPKHALWFEGVGFGVENHGVEPDVEVPVSPQDWLAGRDPQLETAIRLALEALDTRPAAAPPELP